MTLDLRTIAHALGGEVSCGAVLCPGPGHTRRDRSLSVKPSAASPDGFIVHSHAGDDFRECRDHVKARLGIASDAWRSDRPAPGCPAHPVRPDPVVIDRTKLAAEIWFRGVDPRGTLVERYLESRRLQLDDVVAGAVIRFHPSCPWRDRKTDTLLRVPAMLAAMRLIDGDTLVAVHRTRLTEDGRKVARMMLGPAVGAAIKLDPDDAVTDGLVVGEGIETVMSGRLLGFRPAWAMGSAGAIARLPVLPGVSNLSILTEQDETGANERAVEECGERWYRAGREVTLIEPRQGKDLNDAIMMGAL